MVEQKGTVNNRSEMRERVVEVANVTFRERGIKALKMDELATQLSMSKRTLYELFEDKETLLMACIHQNQKNGELFMQEVVSTSNNVLEIILRGYKRSIELAQNTTPKFIEEIHKYPKAYEAMMNRHDSDMQRTIAFFHQGVEQELFRPDVNYPIFQELIRNWMDMMLTTDILKKYSFLEVFESIILTSLRGISTEKGINLLDEFVVELKKQK
ncbi:MAG: TetR/AcrR family transcriptional regulator [Bacteroides sp.]|nr:TetR/AcrR family transcriptional regulator [Bacteroides sp.]